MFIIQKSDFHVPDEKGRLESSVESENCGFNFYYIHLITKENLF